MSPTIGRGLRARWIGVLATLVLFVSMVASAGELPANADEKSTAHTVVSITFDDATAGHATGARLLEEHGMRGTFYTPSGLIDMPGYLTRGELDAIAAAGHEVGGHTVHHLDLADMDPGEARREVCDDRATLMSWGYEVRSFAYPFASVPPEIEQVVRGCGYSSARGLGDVRTPWGCETCRVSESLPPRDPWLTAAPAQVTAAWTLSDLQDAVTAAESEGGWVQLTFHEICESGCEDPKTTPQLLDDFLDWLQGQVELGAVAVRTVGETVGGDVSPAAPVPQRPSLPTGFNAVVNSDLAVDPATGLPTCFEAGGWGENSATVEPVLESVLGDTATRIRVKDYVSGDAKLLPDLDLGTCAPTVTPGQRYDLRTAYVSTAKPQYSVYLRSAAGVWSYWTSSPYFPATDEPAEAVWQTDPIPKGVTAISFGLGLLSDGDLEIDDVRMFTAARASSLAGTARITGPWRPVPRWVIPWRSDGERLAGPTVGVPENRAGDAG